MTGGFRTQIGGMYKGRPLLGGGGVSGLWMKTDKWEGGLRVKWTSAFEQPLSVSSKRSKTAFLPCPDCTYLATNAVKQSPLVLCFSSMVF